MGVSVWKAVVCFRSDPIGQMLSTAEIRYLLAIEKRACCIGHGRDNLYCRLYALNRLHITSAIIGHFTDVRTQLVRKLFHILIRHFHSLEIYNLPKWVRMPCLHSSMVLAL